MRFRNLTLLLRLLTTINKGTAVLPADDSPPIQDLPIRRKIVDAVTTILVRNREVLAATAYAPGCGSIILADLESGNGSVGTMPAQEAQHAQVTSDNEFDIHYLTTAATLSRLSIAAVANPDQSDSVKHITLASGEDLWSRFDKDHCWKAMRK
jgi:hypothetical protein